jgi:CheY-like chemotaxis protein
VIETQNRKLDAVYAAGHQDVLPGDYVEIAVTDQGCGISPENIEKVFNPFFTTKGPEAGSGLGLSMIYGFVKQSGGHVKIYSEVGIGTTVKMYLPRLRSTSFEEPVEAAEPVQEVEVQAEAVQPQSRRAQVLVVDDNPSVREVAAAMIEDMGFDTITATNGIEGLKTIEERPGIDLMLSDVIMAGGMHGPELAAKAMKLRPDLKVLFMSGYAPGSVRQMQDLPVEVELVNKPFSRSELTEKVRRALALEKAA